MILVSSRVIFQENKIKISSNNNNDYVYIKVFKIIYINQGYQSEKGLSLHIAQDNKTKGGDLFI